MSIRIPTRNGVRPTPRSDKPAPTREQALIAAAKRHVTESEQDARSRAVWEKFASPQRGDWPGRSDGAGRMIRFANVKEKQCK